MVRRRLKSTGAPIVRCLPGGGSERAIAGWGIQGAPKQAMGQLYFCERALFFFGDVYFLEFDASPTAIVVAAKLQ